MSEWAERRNADKQLKRAQTLHQRGEFDLQPVYETRVEAVSCCRGPAQYPHPAANVMGCSIRQSQDPRRTSITGWSPWVWQWRRRGI